MSLKLDLPTSGIWLGTPGCRDSACCRCQSSSSFSLYPAAHSTKAASLCAATSYSDAHIGPKYAILS